MIVIVNRLRSGGVLAAGLGLLLLLALTLPVRAETESAASLLTDHGVLALQRSDQRYGLASLQHSSGFMPVAEGPELKDALQQVPGRQYDLTPDFRQHHRYWLYATVVNNTGNSDWVLHISNSGFQQPRVLVRSQSGTLLQTISNQGYAAGTDINVIGRALRVHLPPGETSQIVVELTAYHFVWHPYIALMSGTEYDAWSRQMSAAFDVAIGMNLGMIILGFICWLLVSERTFFWGALSSLLLLGYYLEHSSLPALLWQYDYEKNTLFWSLVSACQLSMLAFAGSFLQVSRHTGRWYQLFRASAVLTVVVFLLALPFEFSIKSLLYSFNYMVVWIVILSSGIAKVKAEGRYYIIYILGWLPLILSTLQVIVELVFSSEGVDEVTVSYKMISVLYVQALHVLIHAVALILRVKALREEKLYMEYLSQAKSRFMAQSSHDLRQPLHSMKLYLDSLRPYIREEKAEALFSGLQKNQQQMNEAFTSIMDLNKLEAGAVSADIRPVPLSEIFSRIGDEFQLQAAEKNLRFNLHQCSLPVCTDPVLLERLLRNLISNAIKYTDSGRVVVGCRRRGKQVEIQVMDTGRGICPDEQGRIFDIYQRAAGAEQDSGSAGIGLSVVKHIADLLGLPVSMVSLPDKGSTFTVAVPLAGGTDKVQPLTVSKQPLSVVLILENQALAQELAQRLQRWGCKTEILTSLAEACGRHTGLLLCDYHHLKRTDLSPDDRQGWQVAACICPAGEEAAEPWVSLTEPVLPARLRALLNFALRQSKAGDKAVT